MVEQEIFGIPDMVILCMVKDLEDTREKFQGYSYITTMRNILVGTVFGVSNRKDIRFNETYDLKGDFEISLRLIERGFNAIRFNGFVAKADHCSPGGCEDARKAGHNRIRCEALLNKYPTLIVPHPTRAGEIKFVGDTGKR